MRVDVRDSFGRVVVPGGRLDRGRQRWFRWESRSDDTHIDSEVRCAECAGCA